MTSHMGNAPYLALVDDDPHSVRLLSRMLVAHGSPEVEWFGGGHEARGKLEARLADKSASWPSMLIVDLKGHSDETRAFIADLGHIIGSTGLLVVAMAPDLSHAQRETLLEAGASAVFSRQHDREAYRHEVAGIVSFWARSQRLDAVGM